LKFLTWQRILVSAESDNTTIIVIAVVVPTVVVVLLLISLFLYLRRLKARKNLAGKSSYQFIVIFYV